VCTGVLLERHRLHLRSLRRGRVVSMGKRSKGSSVSLQQEEFTHDLRAGVGSRCCMARGIQAAMWRPM
jgi:hypothetical protein